MNVNEATKQVSGKLVFADPGQIEAIRLLVVCGELNTAVAARGDQLKMCPDCAGSGHITCGNCNGDGGVPLKGSSQFDDFRDVARKLDQALEDNGAD